jgi:gelsolin
MTGLVKPKNYDWKDSNLALFGSDVEKNIKKESAAHEPAWANAGSHVGLQIWRIVNFKVVDWPKEDYGKFFNGDSYIILRTYKPNPANEELNYDLHFWIGSNSSQDEYGTAAYKTVELDTHLDDKPIQYREVEGHESELFRSYFPKGIQLLEGGADSGFRHVTPEKYQPRLFHFQGTGKNVVVTQVPAAKSRLNSGDVFILDLGLKIYQWNGSAASPFEKTKAVAFVGELKTERSGKAVVAEVVDEGNVQHPFYAALTQEDVVDKKVITNTHIETQLFRVSDAGGQLQFSKTKSGSVSSSDFDANDVFVLETNKTCFVWIGKNASPAEKQNGFGYAHKHLMSTGNPLRSVIVIKEGQSNSEFQTALAA